MLLNLNEGLQPNGIGDRFRTCTDKTRVTKLLADKRRIKEKAIEKSNPSRGEKTFPLRADQHMPAESSSPTVIETFPEPESKTG